MTTPVRQTQTLFHAMSTQDLATYVNCPLALQDNFERVMKEKYGIVEEAT
jgi:hypothetical protein